MLEMINEMYAQEPFLTICVGVLFVVALTLPVAIKPLFRKQDEKMIQELEESAQRIWEADTSENKEYAWAYAEHLAKSANRRTYQNIKYHGGHYRSRYKHRK